MTAPTTKTQVASTTPDRTFFANRVGAGAGGPCGGCESESRDKEIPARINTSAVNGFIETIVGTTRIICGLSRIQPKRTTQLSVITKALATLDTTGSQVGV